jgi:hypothetical protein
MSTVSIGNTGWQVTAIGRIREQAGPGSGHFLRLAPEIVTGRTLHLLGDTPVCTAC